MTKIRVATTEDAKCLVSIYDYYVNTTAISFELETPTIEEFKDRMNTIQKMYPYLVLEEEGKILGYAYAAAFHPRKAYEHCVELTVYLAPEARGKGYGKQLYQKLEEFLKLQHINNAYACIAHTERVDDPNLTNKSEAFHQSLGYRLIGRFINCGYKFERWYDMVWMEKILLPHEVKALPILNFKEVQK